MKEIKTLLQEADFYESQGLKQDALSRYITASKILIKHTKGKNKQKLIKSISKKIHKLENAIYHDGEDKKKPELSKTSQDIVKNLFSYSKDLEKDEAAFEGAKLLAELGQYERAIDEFADLMKNKKLRAIVAKNIIRCHLSNSTPALAVEHFKKWMDSQLFNKEQLEKIRSFIKIHFEKYSIGLSLPELNKRSTVKIPDSQSNESNESNVSNEYNESDESDEILDIVSMVIVSENSKLKDKPLELDINFQNENNINVIIPRNQKEYVKDYQPGDRIQNIQFFSTEAFFMGSARILSITRIDTEPRVGSYSLDIEMID